MQLKSTSGNARERRPKWLPKWTKKSHLGMCVGHSSVHASSVGRVLSLETRFISPQCHIVYDEMFHSVQGELTKDPFNEILWTKLLTLGHSRVVDPTNEDDEGEVVPFHDFHDNLSLIHI